MPRLEPVLEDRMSLSALASISSISSLSVLDTALTLASSSKISPTPPASSASTISAADLRKDLSALLSSLASGDVAAARAGLAQLEADTQIAPAETVAPSSIVEPVASATPPGLESTAGSDSAASSSSQLPGSVHALLAKLSESLDSGKLDAAVTDLSGFLTRDGHSNGNLLSTAA